MALPVYRTYVRPGRPAVDDDRAAIVFAASEALAHHPELEPGLIEHVSAVLRGVAGGRRGMEVAVRFQQLTGPAMAKGVEDTAFYRFTRLVSLNEVGGDPGRVGIAVGQFHAANAEALSAWPHAMRASSTHDTKRSEDVRARLHLLAEIPVEWAAAADRWGGQVSGRMVGSRDLHLEYLLHQTLVGAYPLSPERAHDYATKAMREAKRLTSWLAPDEGFEAALHDVLDGLLGDEDHQRDLSTFVAPLVGPGRVNVLAQKLLTLTVPGVPDLYQGSELWTTALVDPDNRRPVDYERRRELLAELDREGPPGADGWGLDRLDEPGRAKLWLVRTALRVRREERACFIGDAAWYEPLAVEGEAADHAIAFVRGGRVATVVPRLPIALARSGGWRDTVVILPPGRWVDALTGRVHDGGRPSVAAVLDRFPVALLVQSG